MDRETILVNEICIEWIYLSQNVAPRMGPPPGRYPCKQNPMKASPPSWLLRV